MPVPKYDELFNPLLKAMHLLGGSASVQEIHDAVVDIMEYPEKVVNSIHRGTSTQLKYRLAWSRNYLKRYGLLENSARGVWALTQEGLKTKEVDKEEVKRYVKSLGRDSESVEEEVEEGDEPEEDDKMWQDELSELLLSMPPDAFERLCQRVLRESGFVQVEVTGQTGDGGIDGKGVLRINGLISFYVYFQCKRYSGSIGPDKIRDFRGAVVGRADKSLFLTTGTFTRAAKEEATRDGAPPIDLIDGEMLVEKIKELGLGVEVKTEEAVHIKKDWFENI